MRRAMSLKEMAAIGAAALVGGGAVGGAGALAQTGSGGTITDGNSVYRQADSPTVNTGAGSTSADLRIGGAAGTDSVFQFWWWYRVNGVHTREFCLANATSFSWAGDTGTMNFTTPEFTAVATWVVDNLGDDTAHVNATLAVTNTTGAALNLALFAYADFDYGGSAGGDSGALAAMPANTITITDGTAPVPFNLQLGYFRGPGADAYRVTPFATLRGELSNTTVNNLDNAGLPFGPGDWTGAWQYNRMIPAGQSTTVRAVIGVGPSVPPDPSGCPADFNGVGGVTLQDLFDYLGAWFANLPSADFNGVGGVTLQDLFDYLGAWFTGCP